MDTQSNEKVLRLLFEQEDAYKFIIGIIVFIVIPQSISLINTFIKNKEIKKFNRGVVAKIEVFTSSIETIRDRTELIYRNNFEEATLIQIENMFRGRIYIDIDNLIKSTKQVVLINHIEDKEATKIKLDNHCKTVIENTKLVMNHFKHNGIPCGAFVNKDWATILSKIVFNFLYQSYDEVKCGKRSYSYDALKLSLKSQYDSFIIEFVTSVNEDRIV
jgi:hypothetical protein